MDYSPWSEREIMPILGVTISPIPESPHPPKLVYMNYTSFPTCMNFLSQFRLIKFFDTHGLQSMVGKGNLAKFESSSISETGKPTPTKIDVHALEVNPYLHEFFESILIN